MFGKAHEQKGKAELAEILSAAPSTPVKSGFYIQCEDGKTRINLANVSHDEESPLVPLLVTLLRKVGAREERDYEIFGSDIDTTFENISAAVMQRLRNQLSMEIA